MSSILCLIDSLGAGGAERQLAYLSVLLKEKGHEIHLVAFTTIKFYDSFLRENGIIPIYNTNGINKYRRIWEIAKLVRKYNPDLVVAYKDGVCISSILAKFFGRFNLVVSERSTTPVLSKKEKIKFWLYRFSDHIVPNSFSQASVIKSLYPNLSKKVKVIVNTVDTEKFRPNQNFRQDDTVHILTTARVNKLKNIINYLHAVKIIVDKGYKCKFEWYGKSDKNDDYPKMVRDEIEKLEIGQYVHFHSAAKDVEHLYREADIFCLPSIIEGFPNVICEAMASGLPIVCSDICDNPLIVENCRNGLLFDPLDPQDIADKIIRMIDLNHEERNEIGLLNREKIISLCSKETFTDAYLSLI